MRLSILFFSIATLVAVTNFAPRIEAQVPATDSAVAFRDLRAWALQTGAPNKISAEWSRVLDFGQDAQNITRRAWTNDQTHISFGFDVTPDAEDTIIWKRVPDSMIFWRVRPTGEVVKTGYVSATVPHRLVSNKQYVTEFRETRDFLIERFRDYTKKSKGD